MSTSDYTDNMRIICTEGIYQQRTYDGATEHLGLHLYRLTPPA